MKIHVSADDVAATQQVHPACATGWDEMMWRSHDCEVTAVARGLVAWMVREKESDASRVMSVNGHAVTDEARRIADQIICGYIGGCS